MKLIVIILTFLVTELPAQPARIHKEYSQSIFRGVRYGWYVPSRQEPGKLYPLVLYLHGSGDTLSRDNYWYKESIQKENPLFVLSPKCVNGNQGWGNTWNPQHSHEMNVSLELVDSLLKKFPIDPERLYIYGISMGGFGVFSVLQKNPGRFAGAYAVCGGSDVKAADQIMKTPLWIFHGDADDIVPVHLSRDIYNEIIKRGGKLTKYTEYPGVKHNSWENVNKELELPSWLLAQKKK